MDKSHLLVSAEVKRSFLANRSTGAFRNPVTGKADTGGTNADFLYNITAAARAAGVDDILRAANDPPLTQAKRVAMRDEVETLDLTPFGEQGKNVRDKIARVNKQLSDDTRIRSERNGQAKAILAIVEARVTTAVWGLLAAIVEEEQFAGDSEGAMNAVFAYIKKQWSGAPHERKEAAEEGILAVGHAVTHEDLRLVTLQLTAAHAREKKLLTGADGQLSPQQGGVEWCKRWPRAAAQQYNSSRTPFRCRRHRWREQASVAKVTLAVLRLHISRKRVVALEAVA